MEENTIRKRLNGVKGDKVIWIIILSLCIISLFAVYSSGVSLANKNDTSTISMLFKQFSFVIFGLAALMLCYMVPLSWYRRLAKTGLAAAICLLVLVAVAGQELNGASRWLVIFGVSFQPSEFAKIALILYLAKAIEEMENPTFREYFIKIIIPIGITLTLILVGSASVAISLGIISLLILIIAGIKWSYIFKTMGIAVAALVLFFIFNTFVPIFPRFNTAVSRIENYFNKEEVDMSKMSKEEIQKEADKHHQANMARIAVASGKLFGKGPGNSTQRYILPHPYSDFIYAIIVEEYGLAGGILILFLYTWFFFRCIRIARRCNRTFSAMLAVGMGLLITFQAMLHILVNVGILPVTGHTLPLISLGGTSYILLSSAFGIVLSVSRTLEKQKKTETPAEEYFKMEEQKI